MNRILVPIDADHFGEYALPFAVAMARVTGASLELVHVHTATAPDLELEGFTPYAFEHVREAEEAFDHETARHELEDLQELARQTREETGIAVEAKLIRGPVIQTLHQRCEEGAADLVVMATHGRSGLKRAWLGSVANSLLRCLSTPLVLVRPPEHPRRGAESIAFRRIVVPLDGSSFAEEILDHVAPLVRAFEARLSLIQVVSPALGVGARAEHVERSDYLEQLRSQARDYLDEVAGRLPAGMPRATTEVVVHRNPALGILEFATRTGMDMIAMSSHGRAGLSRVLMGSTADEIVQAAELPVLVFRPSASARPDDGVAVPAAAF